MNPSGQVVEMDKWENRQGFTMDLMWQLVEKKEFRVAPRFWVIKLRDAAFYQKRSENLAWE